MAIQGSAPNFSAKYFSSAISCFGKYFFSSVVSLHSIASFRTLLPARRSGQGYWLLPLPAARIAAQPFSQNLWMRSRSAFVPRDLVDMVLVEDEGFFKRSGWLSRGGFVSWGSGRRRRSEKENKGYTGFCKAER